MIFVSEKLVSTEMREPNSSMGEAEFGTGGTHNQHSSKQPCRMLFSSFYAEVKA